MPGEVNKPTISERERINQPGCAGIQPGSRREGPVVSNWLGAAGNLLPSPILRCPRSSPSLCEYSRPLSNPEACLRFVCALLPASDLGSVLRRLQLRRYTTYQF